MLQDYIREQSRQQVIEKYGAGPHRVEFQVASYHNKKPGQFVVELAPLNFVPHAIETFLDIISNGLWDNTVFYHHNTQHHVLAAAPVNYGTFEPKHYHFDGLGYTGVGFPEYSESFPNDKYTLGFSGKGPRLLVFFGIVHFFKSLLEGMLLLLETVFKWHNWYRDWRIVLSLVYTVVIATAVPYYLVAITLKMITGTEMTLVSTLNPVVGALFVKILVGELLDI
jgi:hypothetical protein